MIPRRGTALCALALLCVSLTAAAKPATVVAVVSAGHPAYREAEAGVKEALLAAFPDVEILSITLDDPRRRPEAIEALGRSPSVVVGIGSRAAQMALEHAGDSPLVYTMVLDPASIGLPPPGKDPAENVTGVALDVSPEQQFELIHELMPEARRIGVLYDPAISGDEVRRATASARASGLTLVGQPVRNETEVMSSAALLAPEVDALWALADPTVLTSANTRPLILFWLRAGKPFFAMSEGFVRSGALAALAADPRQVGRRAGELAARILQGTPAKALKPEPPPRLSLFLNLASAHHLGLTLPDAALARADAAFPASGGAAAPSHLPGAHP
ncbi:MAG TPA: ABC transporter substrate-binding protein [Candidatus Polarisedimenticolia bacterium]|nr:ABC transporter substrate-binding protein [Candidatus Polarisedimenticolia bacterium]